MKNSINNLIKVDEWNGQYVINEAYRPIAGALIKKYPEIGHIPLLSILFIDNTTGTGTSRNKRKNAQIGKIPTKWQEIIKQLTGHTFIYYMEFFRLNISEMSQEQIIALIYHELRHIDINGDLRHHDIEDWSEMVAKLGPDWHQTMRSLPNLLDDGVDWGSIQSQGLFSEPRMKLVK